VAGAATAFGDGAMSNSIADFKKADLLFVIGSNTTECHPIIGRYVRQAVRAGTAKLIVADPRTIKLAGKAVIHLRQKPGSDVALLNAMMNVILTEDLYDKQFVAERTEGFEEMSATVKNYTPEMAEEITGVTPLRIGCWKAWKSIFPKAWFATAGRCLRSGRGMRHLSRRCGRRRPTWKRWRLI